MPEPAVTRACNEKRPSLAFARLTSPVSAFLSAVSYVLAPERSQEGDFLSSIAAACVSDTNTRHERLISTFHLQTSSTFVYSPETGQPCAPLSLLCADLAP